MKYSLKILLIALFLMTSLSINAELSIKQGTSLVVEIEQQIKLELTEPQKMAIWAPVKGQIIGESIGNSIVYLAPSLPGQDIITIFDDTTGDAKTLHITVELPKAELSPENAVWEIFTSRNSINSLLISDNEKTLWVGSTGGLEKRNGEDGRIQAVYHELNSKLPSNIINDLVNDGSGGIWGATSKGLLHIGNDDLWTIYNTTNLNFPLPSNNIAVLLNDNTGLWVGTDAGLGYFSHGTWTVYTQQNSKLPSNDITALAIDNENNIWIGTDNGLIKISHNQEWIFYNTENSKLPNNFITTLYASSKGIWVATTMLLFDDDEELSMIFGLLLEETNGELTLISTDNEWLTLNSNNSDIDSRIYNIKDDNMSNFWLASEQGLIYLSSDNKTKVYDSSNTDLPESQVQDVIKINQETTDIWIGLSNTGLINFSTHRKNIQYTQDSLPSSDVMTISNNKGNTLWVGTQGDIFAEIFDKNGGGGLLKIGSSDEWKVYTKENSELPNNSIDALYSTSNELWGVTSSKLFKIKANDEQILYKNITLSGIIKNLLPDNEIGVWLGSNKGLTHVINEQDSITYTIENSNIPSDAINVLLHGDNPNEIWVGTDKGLAYFNSDGQWLVYDSNNSSLPNDKVTALLRDDEGNTWVGTHSRNLLQIDTSGNWLIHVTPETVNFSGINALLDDKSDGLWVATNNGLMHRSIDNQWDLFKVANKDYPYSIRQLENDDNNGVWVASDKGLLHLMLRQKNSAQIAGERAAIILAGGGKDDSNTLWQTTEKISNYIYKVLYKRGFSNQEIFYLSPAYTADFNGDGSDDNIIDEPKPTRELQIQDIDAAFAWAETRGQLSQPLYIFLLDHGEPNAFGLAKGVNVSANEIKALLDNYQAKTGNQVIVVVDACYSGEFIEKLKAENRAVLSSTGNSLAYFDRANQLGFSYYLGKGLLRGRNFKEAFDFASAKQDALIGELKLNNRNNLVSAGNGIEITQVPQFDDGSNGQWLSQVYLNGSFVTANIGFNVIAISPKQKTIDARSEILLQSSIPISQRTIKRAWAIIRPPSMDLILDQDSTPILAYPQVQMGRVGMSSTYEATWKTPVYSGEYQITFYAEDTEGEIENSETVTVAVINGQDIPATAQLKITSNQTVYHLGDQMSVELTENLGWGYDLYVVVQLPTGQLFFLRNTNLLKETSLTSNNTKPWDAKRVQGEPLTIIDLPLPQLSVGEYCFYGILSPQKQDVFLNQNKWVLDSQCVTFQ